MKLYLRITLIVMSGVSLASLFTGCAIPMKEDIARSTTEFNLVAEKAGNEMLLLNIVRASKRRPMYFTSIGKLTGNKTFEYGTGGVSIPFGRIGGGLNGSYSIAPSAGYKNSPLFDVTVLNTKEFTNGIMTPVPMKTIGYYRSQGWHKEMLLHLFIRRIEIKNPNDLNNPDVYLNYPGDRKEFCRFQTEIRTSKWDIVKDPNHNATLIGEVDANDVLKVESLIAVQKAGLTIKTNKKNDKKELHLSQVKYVFAREKKGQKVPFDEKQGTIYQRSPEAILYYLGEILRAENKTGDPNIAMIDVSHDRLGVPRARLFYARARKARDEDKPPFYAHARKARDEDKSPCVSVDYEGTKYFIPGDPDGYGTDRSMHVLSLVSQLIGLQKKIEEAPATGVVSVIGR